MKTKLTFLLSLTFLFLLLTGFSLGGFVDNVRFKGTSVGITKCVERNKQEEISQGIIREKCFEEHQKILKMPPNEVRGKYVTFSGMSFFEITYTNNSSDMVITYFQVKVSHVENKDLDGNQITEIIQFKNMLIPPTSTSVESRKIKFLPRSGETLKFTSRGLPIFNGDRKQVVSSDYSFSMGDTYKGVDFILK
jgi:hypothetical protein